MRKEQLWKSMLAVLTCTTLVLSGPLAYAAEQEVSVQKESRSEFQIEDGVLVRYNGDAREVIVPEGVTSIGDGAFGDCSNLTSIKLPEGVTSIGVKAFGRCSSLTSIELPEGVTSIGDNAFDSCSSLTSIELPESVTSIGSYAFSFCSSLTSIELPEGVTSIGIHVFYNSGLTSINVASQNSKYANYEDCLYNKDLTELIYCPVKKSEVKLSNNLISIGERAFSDCSSLTSIELPEGVTSIGDYAFFGCSSLTSIELPEGVTSIENYAFMGCSNLIIYCKEGSYAQQYAIKNELKYELIGASSENPAETPEETPKHEVDLTSENTSITSSDMQGLADINRTQDVVVNSTDGVKFTFPKGTMKMIEGKESYDFGVELITDYSRITNSPFAEDEFAFRLNYNYEGKLPSENTVISILVDKKWIGQKLYYYRISGNGEYAYLTSAVVDNNGIYTITQGQCSDYIAVLRAPEEQTETPTEPETPLDEGDSPDTGDIDMSLYIALCIVGLAGVFAAGCKKAAR